MSTPPVRTAPAQPWPSQPVLGRCAAAAQRVGQQIAQRGTASADDPDLWSVGPRHVHAVATAHARLTGEDPRPDIAHIDPRLCGAVMALAQPPHILLALGTDSRARPTRGTNAYGMPLLDMHPRLPASSCTATPPDAVTVAAVDTWRQRLLVPLLNTGTLPSAGQVHDSVCDGIAAMLGLPENPRPTITLTSSGTDALLLLLAILLDTARDRTVSVITVGARETGSGIPHAARGHHFTCLTPMGSRRDPGTPVDGLDSTRLRVIDVELRDQQGRIRSTAAIRAEIEYHIARTTDTLVYLPEVSKTGIRAAHPSWIRRWRTLWPHRLHIAIDAAQFRTPTTRLRHYLDAGASLIITGSKALSAPPFCGAVVLSPPMADAADRITALPAGLADYLTAANLPTGLCLRTAGLDSVNFGLLARWTAALREWDQFRAQPPALRRHLRTSVIHAWRGVLARIPDIRVEPAMPDTTIVSFVPVGPNGPVGLARAQAAYHEITDDGGCYLGQPVELAPHGPAALRLAVGAATLNRLAAGHCTLDELIEATVYCLSRCRMLDG